MIVNTMSCQGYLARIEYDPRDNIFVGHVLGLADRISFHGETVVELTNDFHGAVDHYLADCKSMGRQPEKPASGKLMLRIRPEVHAAAAIAAKASGMSLNQWADEVLERAASH